jgi:hypothetical protein
MTSMANAVELTDHPDCPRAEKKRLLADWDQFLGSGFSEASLTPELYGFLTWDWKMGEEAHIPNRAYFWRRYFADEIDPLIDLLNRFLRPSEQPSSSQDEANEALWAERFADPVVGDLNRAIYDRMRLSITHLYDAWYRYMDLYLTRRVEKETAHYAQITPGTTEQDLDAYRKEAYHDMLIHQDVNHSPVTDELRTMFAQAAVKHKAKLITQPPLFAVLEKRRRLSRPQLGQTSSTPTSKKVRREDVSRQHLGPIKRRQTGRSRKATNRE